MTRHIIAALVVLIIAALIVLTFTSVKTVLTCKGEITRAGQSRPVVLYASLIQYRWWTRLWGDSDGNLMIELDSGQLRFFEALNIGPNIVGISMKLLGKLEYHGSYSKLSKSLKLKTGFGYFDGTCTTDK